MALGAVLALVVVAVVWKLVGGSGGGDPPRAGSAATEPHAPGATAGAPAVDGDDHRAAHVTVTVRDDAGPITGATVRLAAGDGDDVIVLRTGSGGVVRSPDLPAGSVHVAATADGHEPAGVTRELIAGDDARVDLVLHAGGATLTGTVTDMTGGPVAGARVDAAAFRADGAAPTAVATSVTGADGRYRVAVARGTLNVAVRSADYAPQSRYVVVAAAIATADFALVPGGVIEGVVRDVNTREPVAGARVEARRDGSGLALVDSGQRVVTAGGDGTFRIAGLRPGAYRLHATAGDRRTRTSALLNLGVAEQVTGVEILVGTGPVIRGVCRDDTGAGVGSATITAYGTTRDGGEATTGSDGAFELVGLPAGRWALTGHAADFVPAGTTAVELGARDATGIEVHLKRGARLTGHIEPRQACNVQLEPSGPGLEAAMPLATDTGSDGEFSLGPVAPGAQQLAARCTSGDAGTLAADAPATGVVLHVTPGASIAGRVVDAHGDPVPAVAVAASLATGPQRTVIVNGMITSGAQAITDGSGAFEIRGLGAGEFSLAVLDRGHALTTIGRKPVRVTVAASEHRTGVEIAVDRAQGTIEGVVTGPDGQPVADAWVSASQDLASMLGDAMGPGGGSGGDDGPSGTRTVTMMDSDDGGGGGGPSDLPPALTDAGGHYKLVGLTHASYDVVAEAQGGKLHAAAHGVVPDATANLQLAGITAIAGTVHAAGGAVPALYTVTLSGGPTQAERDFAAADGSFDLDRVEPGSYEVTVSSSDGNASQQVTVAAGQTAHVDLVLAANAVVTGHVVDATGKPVGGVPVVVEPDSGDGRVSVSLHAPPPTTSPDGSFRVDAKPGPAMLILLASPPVTRRGLALEAGKTTDVGSIVMK
nr:carboxypeptidase-like regulatory domain-containing protein [Kofleriaceae bacterium]